MPRISCPRVIELKQNSSWKTYVIWIVLTEAVGLLAGLLTREATALYNATAVKPPLSPPAILFPIVWTILYALMGFGAARIYLAPESGARTRSLQLYLAQLAFNFFWSILFFNFEAYGLSLIWLVILWALIFLMTLSFHRVDPLAAYLQIPYLVWVAFAAYLNLGVFLLNG